MSLLPPASTKSGSDERVKGVGRGKSNQKIAGTPATEPVGDSPGGTSRLSQSCSPPSLSVRGPRMVSHPCRIDLNSLAPMMTNFPTSWRSRSSPPGFTRDVQSLLFSFPTFSDPSTYPPIPLMEMRSETQLMRMIMALTLPSYGRRQLKHASRSWRTSTYTCSPQRTAPRQ